MGFGTCETNREEAKNSAWETRQHTGKMKRETSIRFHLHNLELINALVTIYFYSKYGFAVDLNYPNYFKNMSTLLLTCIKNSKS